MVHGWLLVLIALITLYYIWHRSRNSTGKPPLPPGPTGIPIVGYWPFLDRRIPLWRNLDQLSRTYGDIFTIQVGWKRFVVLNRLSKIESAFRREVFQGRPPWWPMQTYVSSGEDAITFVEGPAWRVNRKIAVRAISHLLQSPENTIEQTLHTGLRWLFGRIDTSLGTPVKTDELLYPMTGAIMASLSFGSEPNPDGPFFERLIEITKAELETTAMEVLDFHPYLYPIYWLQIRNVQKGMKEMMDFVLREAECYLSTIEDSRSPNIAAVVEHFIRTCPQERKDEAGITNKDMRRMLTDIYHAGYFTSAENIVWAMVFLSLHPDKQELVAEELARVLGGNRMVSLADLERLHVTRATAHEVMRYGSNSALGLPHRVLADTVFEGYFFPKGTEVLANIWAVNFDPAIFPDPYKFRPERFLDQNGHFSEAAAKNVGNFSFGKRRCVGEPLAKKTVPLLMGSIIRNYQVALEPGTSIDPINDVTFMLTVQPKEHRIVFKRRK